MNLKNFKTYMDICAANGIVPTWEGLNQFKSLLKSHKAAQEVWL